MSAPPTETPDEEYDYVQEDEDEEDEDDDDEIDFVPGKDDEDDDDEDDEDDDQQEVVPLMDGALYLDKDQKLHYRGEGFHLSSNEAIDGAKFNPLSGGEERNDAKGGGGSSSSSHSIHMEGPCDVETGSGNPTYRKFEVTWTRSITSGARASKNAGAHLLEDGNKKQSPALLKRGDDDDDDCQKKPPHRKRAAARLKGGDEDDDDDDDTDQRDFDVDDEKLPAASCCYDVVGHQVDLHEGHDQLEFRGTQYPPPSSTANNISNANPNATRQQQQRANLVCRVRMIISANPIIGSPKAPPVAAAAAAAVASAARVADEDDEDEDYYAGENVDYDELIALHEDAGLPVADLRKRYRNGGSSSGGAAAAASRSKRGKRSSNRDDDDDYGF